MSLFATFILFHCHYPAMAAVSIENVQRSAGVVQGARRSVSRSPSDAIIHQLDGIDISTPGGRERVRAFICSGATCRDMSCSLRLASDRFGFNGVYDAIKGDLQANSDLQHAFAWRGRDYVAQMDAVQLRTYGQIAAMQLARFLEGGQVERAENFREHVQSVLPDFSPQNASVKHIIPDITSHAIPATDPQPAAPQSLSLLLSSSADPQSAGQDAARLHGNSTFLYFLSLQQTGNPVETNFHIRQRRLLSRRYAKTPDNEAGRESDPDFGAGENRAASISKAAEKQAFQIAEISGSAARSGCHQHIRNTSVFVNCSVYEAAIIPGAASNKKMVRNTGAGRPFKLQNPARFRPGRHIEKKERHISERKHASGKTAKLINEAKGLFNQALAWQPAKKLQHNRAGIFASRTCMPILLALKQSRIKLPAHLRANAGRTLTCPDLSVLAMELRKRINQKTRQAEQKLGEAVRRQVKNQTKNQAMPAEKKRHADTSRKFFRYVAEINKALGRRVSHMGSDAPPTAKSASIAGASFYDPSRTSVQRLLLSHLALTSLCNKLYADISKITGSRKILTDLVKLRKLLYLLFVIRFMLLYANKREKRAGMRRFNQS